MLLPARNDINVVVTYLLFILPINLAKSENVVMQLVF